MPRTRRAPPAPKHRTRRASPAPYPPNSLVRRLLDGGWNPAALAERLGVSLRTVLRWAVGDSRPLPAFEREMTSLSPPQGKK